MCESIAKGYVAFLYSPWSAVHKHFLNCLIKVSKRCFVRCNSKSFSPYYSLSFIVILTILSLASCTSSSAKLYPNFLLTTTFAAKGWLMAFILFNAACCDIVFISISNKKLDETPTHVSESAIKECYSSELCHHLELVLLYGYRDDCHLYFNNISYPELHWISFKKPSGMIQWPRMICRHGLNTCLGGSSLSERSIIKYSTLLSSPWKYLPFTILARMPFGSMVLSKSNGTPVGSSRRDVKYRVASSTIGKRPSRLIANGSMAPSGTWRDRIWCRRCRVSIPSPNLSQLNPVSCIVCRIYGCCLSSGLHFIHQNLCSIQVQLTYFFNTGGRSLLAITPCKVSTNSSTWVASEPGMTSLQ